MRMVTEGYVAVNGMWYATQREAEREDIRTELMEYAQSLAGTLSSADVSRYMVRHVIDNYTLAPK